VSKRVLKVVSEGGRVLLERPVDVGLDADPATLHAVARRYVLRQRFRYAEIVGDGFYALFLAPDLVPRASVVLLPPPTSSGVWLTHSLDVGPEDSGVVGPSVFFRLSHLVESERWILHMLHRLPLHVDSWERDFDDGSLVEWTHWGNRYYCWFHQDHCSVYGAGNTPREAIAVVVRRQRPSSARGYLRTTGAVRLA